MTKLTEKQELIQAIIGNFKEEDKKFTFAGWKHSMIVGYYMQFVHKHLTEKDVEDAINEACKQLQSERTY